MPNALHYLLVTRLKEEVGIREDNYLLWASLFPRGLDVKDTRAKATNLGKRRYDQLLGDLAAEWQDDSSKRELIERVAAIGTRSRRGSRVPEDDLHRLVAEAGGERAIAELDTLLDEFEAGYAAGVHDRAMLEGPLIAKTRTDDGAADVHAALGGLLRAQTAGEDARRAARLEARDKLLALYVCDPAKQQLVDAVRASVERQTVCVAGVDAPSVLGRTLAAHASDPWVSGAGDEPDDYRGLGFLFAEDFKESFDAMVRREFGWQEQRLFVRFWQEYRYLQDQYLTGTCSAEREAQIIVGLFTFCVLACLVGPGSFAEELGFGKPDALKTVIRMDALQPSAHAQARYQLQPVVFNGHDGRTYYTADEPPVVFDAGEVVRFGRDGQWMGEIPCKAITFTDGDVSRRHAELCHTPKGWEIVDMGDGRGSANGTLVFRAFGGPIFRKRGFTAEERAIKIQSGDIIYIAPPQGASYDVELRRGRVLPEIGKEHRAFRFERRG